MTYEVTNKGQALPEVCLSIMILIPLIYGVSLILRDRFRQAECAYSVFEATHERLIGAKPRKYPYTAEINEFPNKLTGTATCGKGKERVEFYHLESTP